MTKPLRSDPVQGKEEFYQPSPRPGFGFLLGGTTVGIFVSCLLLCAGAGPPEVIIILLAILGAIAGGLLEAFWPKPGLIPRPTPPASKPSTPKSRHECPSCGEVFTPAPVTCPMCGHADCRNP